ncbi:hypothetical protein IPR78_22295 [Xanthomonas perforans]|nr:hypothetical protein [Xanthomonas perforans]MBZ2690760.1 hypothetical protein [Xanthomonas perforans]MBZ2707965.1 hypothetical protein [Xanthomonas perforans]MBZ2824992.1 hypothetical protein [Xanthomonas perforans]MBZ2842244.1 hypothetical protein [Xanthomonas perforans]
MIHAQHLSLELIDAQSFPLVRLFHYPGMEWNPPDPMHRNLRVDPPDGHKSDFGVLYMSNRLLCVAMECRVIVASEQDDELFWLKSKTEHYKIVRYIMGKPAIFLPLDGHNKALLGLVPSDNQPRVSYASFQNAAFEIFQRFGSVIHGLSWDSYHRGQPGRVYALWHHHKVTVGLRITTSKPYIQLCEDEEWKQLLLSSDLIERD